MQSERSKKTIAIIAGNISNEFCKELVESIRNSIPRGRDIQLIVLPGEALIRGEYPSNPWQYDAMFNGVYSLGNKCRPDGLIIVEGSMGWIVEATQYRRFLESFDDIPKILLTSPATDMVTVNYDNEAGIRETIDYLVNVNGFTKICMLGGTETNPDAKDRKDAFIRCLEKNGLPFREEFYEAGNMSSHTEREARILLDNNPDVEAVLCVNDTSAVGLYNVMRERRLEPGVDIMVIGFDNTRLSSEMNPPLSSIGPDDTTLGQKALAMLLDMMNGIEVKSARVGTRLYGRQSFPYEMYQYTNRELLDVDEAFIYRMFDDCFYRYRYSAVKSSDVNLRRLYFEFISRILNAYRNKFMPLEDYEEICGMIDVFFANGAMDHTDSERLLSCIAKLQDAINVIQRSLAVNGLINRLFLRMKDDCIKEICRRNVEQNKLSFANMKRLREHMVSGMDYAGDRDATLAAFIRNMDHLGFANAVLYMFDSPVDRQGFEAVTYPDDIIIQCIIKDGEVYIPPPERRRKKTKELFDHASQTTRQDCLAVFPIFYERRTYGLFACELTEQTYNMGSMIMSGIGMNMRLLERNT